MTGLVRWEPILRDIDTLAGRFHRMFDRSWPHLADPTVTQPVAMGWYPVVDIYDEGDFLKLEAELAGYKRDDIDVRVENGTLILSGERRPFAGENGGGRQYLRSERSFGRFSRSFSLPTMVNTQNIEATYPDGILTVTLPKSEASRPRRIDVKVH